ncbi:hypothetical protein B0A48_13905 [Cryoendolithus antarcticus]|uniref:Uncharacterized protein n=1 Tax=Cryoendolithus antarcticus TaxID=1507870 RepID=A0A1V8SM73_9PEZI|nr:hypothetical protein B0A48_13905 [Cryoendolithus antarcticus]
MAIATLTPRHLSLLRVVAQTPNKPNWAQIAKDADFLTAKVARDTWGMIRKKLEVKNGNTKLSPRQLDLLRVYALNISSAVSTNKQQKSESESESAVLTLIQIDWNDVATEAGLSTKKVARDTWLIVKKKLGSVKKGGDHEDEDQEAVESIEEHEKFEVKHGKGSKKRKAATTDEEVATPRKETKTTMQREPSAEAEGAGEEVEGSSIIDHTGTGVSDSSQTQTADTAEPPVMGVETTEDIEKGSAENGELTNEHAEDENLIEQKAHDAQLLFGL